MASATVRVSADTLNLLRTLAHREGASMRATLAHALEAYRRQRFLTSVSAAYGELRGNARAWKEVEAERDAWDATLSDGLAPEGAVTPRTTGKSPKSRRVR